MHATVWFMVLAVSSINFFAIMIICNLRWFWLLSGELIQMGQPFNVQWLHVWQMAHLATPWMKPWAQYTVFLTVQAGSGTFLPIPPPSPPPPLPGLELVVEDRPTELSCTCIILCAYQLINVCAFFSLSLLLLYLLQAMVALTLGSLPWRKS